MKVFLVSGSTKDVGTLFSALKRRLDTVKKSSTNTSQSTPNKETSKRKLSEEQKDTEVKSNEEGNDEQKPPPEKEAKLVQWWILFLALWPYIILKVAAYKKVSRFFFPWITARLMSWGKWSIFRICHFEYVGCNLRTSINKHA